VDRFRYQENAMKYKDLFSHWGEVRKGLFETLDQFQEEDLAFRPFDGTFSVHEVFLHIASAESGWFKTAVTRETRKWPADYSPEEYPNRAALRTLLESVHAKTVDYLESADSSAFEEKVELNWGPVVPLTWVFWHVLEHEIHHKGELSLILGMLGREAPDM
jgi:uncharacterized damage-inducible protein DinB